MEYLNCIFCSCLAKLGDDCRAVGMLLDVGFCNRTSIQELLLAQSEWRLLISKIEFRQSPGQESFAGCESSDCRQ